MTDRPRHIVILTGAGISAESGVPTFRASDGLWCGHPVEKVATPEGFAADPALVQDFYNQRRRQLAEVAPNAAHHALAKLAAEWEGEFLLVTQNVDDLHDRAHAALSPGPGFGLIHMHGELLKARHVETGAVQDWSDDIPVESALRPHIVWFGEMPFDMERIEEALIPATCSSRSAPRGMSIRRPASSPRPAARAPIRSSSISNRRSARAISPSSTTARRRNSCRPLSSGFWLKPAQNRRQKVCSVRQSQPRGAS